RRDLRQPLGPEWPPRRDPILDAALDALHGGEPADVRDVRRLARPGRDRPRAGHDEQTLALDGLRSHCRTGSVGQKQLQDSLLIIGERPRERREMHEPGNQAADRRLHRGETGEQLLDAKAGEGRGAGKDQQPHHFFSPEGGEYIPMGNCATLAAPSSAVILLTPCFLTSSIRRTECSGRKVRLTPTNSLLMRSSEGSRTTEERSPKTSSSTSM